MFNEVRFSQMTRLEKLAYIRARLDSPPPSPAPRKPREGKHRRPYAVKTAEQKFWRRVRQDGECWLWQRGPFLSVEKGKAVSARLWAIEHFTGKQTSGNVFSTCGHPNCVRPAHQQEVPKGSDKVPHSTFLAITQDARSDLAIAAEYRIAPAIVARIRQAAPPEGMGVSDQENASR